MINTRKGLLSVGFLVVLLALAFWLSSQKVSPQESSIESEQITTGGSVVIEKPLTDDRVYHYLTLPNQLRVLLISDPDTDKSAASLDVHVGSSDDPKDREGLAHFLEHMLFLGTEKYPDASEYQSFISENGGDHNAYTSAEHTNYFFDIKNDKFEEALDRFVQFFTAPLFNEQYVEREREVVQSEYQLKIKDDSRRVYDVYRQVMNPDHPYAKFSVGSLTTLGDREGERVRDDLLSFYEQHYSADQMTLVVLGKESIDELQEMVEQRFSLIPQRNVPQETAYIPLFRPGTLPVDVRIEPVKDLRQMTLVFPLPSVKSYYAEKPLAYLSFLLGHEGQGSLLSLLKAQGWAETLSAGGNESGAENSAFYIVIGLTEAGLQSYEKVKALVFHAIDTIRSEGVEQWRYDEESRLAEFVFKFKDQSRPIRTVSDLADHLHRYPPAQVISAGYLYQRFDADLIHSFLEKMTPDNLYLELEYLGAETDKVTKNYQTPYSVTSVSSELVSLDDELKQQYALPQTNIFVPEDSSLVNQDDTFAEPVRLNNKNAEILVRQDIGFQVPKASIHLRLKLPLVASSLRGSALNELLIALVRDRLNEKSYPAQIAGLSYSMSPHSRGFDANLSGYSDKMDVLVEMLVNELQAPRIQRERFDSIKQELIRGLRNSKQQTPYRQLFKQFSLELFSPFWSDQQIADMLEQVTFEDIQVFSAQWLQGLKLEALFYGNIDKPVIDRWAAQVQSLVKPGSQPLPQSRVLKLTDGQALFNSMYVDHGDKAVALYVQGLSDTIEDQAKMILLRQIFAAPFYNQLRTEQQLGYIVFMTSITFKNVPGSAFVVQSPQTSIEGIQDAMTTFIDQSAALITDDLSTYKQSAEARILERPQSVSAKAGRYWQDLLLRGDTSFTYRQRLVEAINQVSADDLRRYYQRVLLDDTQRVWFTAANSLEDVSAAPDEPKYYIYP